MAAACRWAQRESVSKKINKSNIRVSDSTLVYSFSFRLFQIKSRSRSEQSRKGCGARTKFSCLQDVPSACWTSREVLMKGWSEFEGHVVELTS